VFPTVADNAQSRQDQREGRCPFLSQVAEQQTKCVKSDNSKGVCSISAGSNGPRQDWLVCPHRALDDDLLHPMVRRLFGMRDDELFHVIPVTNLAATDVCARLTDAVHDPSAPRQFLTFQQLFGGEISLPRSPASPELAFDATVVEVIADDTTEVPGVRLGRYGVIELQTTDTHGSYKHAVDALRGALDLHPDDFGAQVAAHPDWPGRQVEGPNISNVFKRTFYQVMFKFQITKRASSAGCILALPKAVWDSWQPFLGAPTLVDLGDGTHGLRGRNDLDGVDDESLATRAPNWIYVFDIAEGPESEGSPTPINIPLIISTDAPHLSRLALEDAPANAIGTDVSQDTILMDLRRRMRLYLPDIS
jgi:hypothetical protein